MTDTDIHSCGYYCDRPLCIKAQRDELRNKLFSDQATRKPIPLVIREPAIYSEPPRSLREAVIDKSMAKRIATQLGWEPKREWVALTEQEQSDIAWEKDKSRIWIVTATEAKLKEKNGG